MGTRACCVCGRQAQGPPHTPFHVTIHVAAYALCVLACTHLHLVGVRKSGGVRQARRLAGLQCTCPAPLRCSLPVHALCLDSGQACTLGVQVHATCTHPRVPFPMWTASQEVKTLVDEWFASYSVEAAAERIQQAKGRANMPRCAGAPSAPAHAPCPRSRAGSPCVRGGVWR